MGNKNTNANNIVKSETNDRSLLHGSSIFGKAQNRIEQKVIWNCALESQIQLNLLKNVVQLLKFYIF